MHAASTFTAPKPQNPRRRANIFARILITWTYPVFKLGNKRDLLISDLPDPLPEHKSSELGDKVARKWAAECRTAKEESRLPSLKKVILQCFLRRYMTYGIYLAFSELFVKMLQPLFLGVFVRYFTIENSQNKITAGYPTYLNRLFYFYDPKRQPPIEKGEAVFFGFCVFLCTCIAVLIQHPFGLATNHMGQKVRVALNSLMYRKTLRLSLDNVSPKTVGTIVNLMTNDVFRFDLSSVFLHYIWVSPVQMIMIVAILYQLLDISAIFGMCAIFVFIPTQVGLAAINKRLRWICASKTDERFQLMNEIILGIHVIKMYAWEHTFVKLMEVARKLEMKLILKSGIIRGLSMSLVTFTARVGIFLTLFTYAIRNGELTTEKMFVVTCYFLIMRTCMTMYFPQGVTQLAETLITIYRIEKFLTSPEAVVGDGTVLDPPIVIERKELKDDERKSIIAVNEFQGFRPKPVFTREIGVRLVDVCAQWAHQEDQAINHIDFEATRSEMIAVVGPCGAGKSTLLNVVLKELPIEFGYLMVTGVVSYCSEEPWLFIGSIMQNIIFGNPMDRRRYRRVCECCALLEDFRNLPFGDQTMVSERGSSLSGGQRARINLARAIYKEADIYLLDDPLSAVDVVVGGTIFQKCVNSFLRNKIRILVTHQLQYLHNVKKMIVMDQGFIVARGSYHDVLNSGVDFFSLLKEGEEEDKEEDEPELDSESVMLIYPSTSVIAQRIRTRLDSVVEVSSLGKVKWAVYKAYFIATGNWAFVAFVGMTFLATQGFASLVDYFISEWSKNIEKKESGSKSDDTFVIMYFAMISVLVLCSISRSIIFFWAAYRASMNLHRRMFNSVVFSIMRFFNVNSSGRILNRFSKDLGAVDEDLPYAMLDFFQIFLNLIGVLVVICVINFFLILPVVLLCVSFYYLRSYYLTTSRSLKRLEGLTRSPMYAHLNASIQGLTTIRVHGAETVLAREFDNYQDMHSGAWYWFLATSRTFSLWMDGLCAILTGLVTFSFFVPFFSAPWHAGQVGLGVTQCVTLTGIFAWGMRQSSEMENMMVSVERVLEFCELEPEPPLDSEPGKKPPPDWPSEGEIRFERTSLYYVPDGQPVLNELSLTIQPMEKLGIVGRTGAGKSSIIQALFRLAFLKGAIYIDGVNVMDIGLHDLRKKLSIIPQEPVIITGSVRHNLDPLREYQDHELHRALNLVELHPGYKNVLDEAMVEGGANYSSGEKQLICLARAIVRNNKILIMDEATAKIDPQTDLLIQRTIRNVFKECTVITIAHRLNTIIDSNRVLVLDRGEIVELDHPYILLTRNGMFHELAQQTGKANFDKLLKEAKVNYHGGSLRDDASHLLSADQDEDEDKEEEDDDDDESSDNDDNDDENEHRDDANEGRGAVEPRDDADEDRGTDEGGRGPRDDENRSVSFQTDNMHREDEDDEDRRTVRTDSAHRDDENDEDRRSTGSERRRRRRRGQQEQSPSRRDDDSEQREQQS